MNIHYVEIHIVQIKLSGGKLENHSRITVQKNVCTQIKHIGIRLGKHVIIDMVMYFHLDVNQFKIKLLRLIEKDMGVIDQLNPKK